MDRATNSKLTTGNSARLLTKGDEAFEAMKAILDGAEHFIDGACTRFRNDFERGLELCR